MLLTFLQLTECMTLPFNHTEKEVKGNVWKSRPLAMYKAAITVSLRTI